MKLQQETIDGWCDRQRPHLSEQARKVVKTICFSEPSRLVRGGRKNVCGQFPSQKMGVTIQFESHKVELPYIYMLEQDDTVIWYFDQPPQIKLNYQADNGREIGFWYTPDLFVMKSDSAGWVECKTQEELERLSIKNPNRYHCDDDGKWHMPPGEEYAKQFGFFFNVFSDTEIDWVLYRNLTFLDDYYRS